MTNDKLPVVPDFPEKDDRSLAYHTARTTLDAAASLVPGAGYAVGELVKRFIGEPLERRREAWFKLLGEGVQELQQRFDGFNPASLGENEEFVSTVFEATQIAMKTHREEKREALKNAALNAAIGHSLDEVLRGSFLAAIDRFSPLHFRVLEILGDPRRSPQYVAALKNVYMNSRAGLIFKLISPNAPTDASLQQVYRDLKREGLTDGSETTSMTVEGLASKATTSAGDAFLAFIRSPLDKP